MERVRKPDRERELERDRSHFKHLERSRVEQLVSYITAQLYISYIGIYASNLLLYMTGGVLS